MKSGGEEERDVGHRGYRDEVEELKVESSRRTASEAGIGLGIATIPPLRNGRRRRCSGRDDNALSTESTENGRMVFR